MIFKRRLLSTIVLSVAFSAVVKCVNSSTQLGENEKILNRLTRAKTYWPAYNRTSAYDDIVSVPINFFGRTNRICEGTHSAATNFPELFTESELRQGAVVLYVFGAVYFFSLLAIVTNEYFLPTVECICEDLSIPKHLAAATFMATATAMPEFFTNVISTLITNSNIGLGTIIGSLMFNTLGVAAVSALAIKKPVQLDWWPVTRDCVIYAFNTLLLVFITWGDVITFAESGIMIFFLLFYYAVMLCNGKFMTPIRIFIEDKMNCCLTTRYDLTMPAENSAKAKLPVITTEPLAEKGIYIISDASGISSTVNLTEQPKYLDDDCLSIKVKEKKLFDIPKDGLLSKAWWVYSLPIRALLALVIPNPVKHRKWYPLSFLMCIVIIGANSYMIVWMLTVVGVTLRIPEIVMGLTLLAAGSTLPEALSSVISIRRGESGIGVSNSLGSNSLAILLSLGLPWFVKNAVNFNNEGENFIRINSQGIEYTVGILLLSTVSLYTVLACGGFRLRRRLGMILIVIYFCYTACQVLIEMNVFFPNKNLCI